MTSTLAVVGCLERRLSRAAAAETTTQHKTSRQLARRLQCCCGKAPVLARQQFGSGALVWQLLLLLLLAQLIVCAPKRRPEPASQTHATNNSQPRHQIASTARTKRAATARLDRLWDDAVIPYEIDPIFDDDKATLFRAAMRHWENFTCIKFVERIPDEHRNYIVFTERSCGCCSFVGKRGNGAQAISIGKHCDKFGIVVHELGHVVGFWHEHTRPDRDQHVQIIGRNIMQGQEYNFNKLTKDEVNSLGLAYDYDSISHYATNTFARDTYLDTILPLHGHLNTEEVGYQSQSQQQQLSHSQQGAINSTPVSAAAASSSSSSTQTPTTSAVQIVAHLLRHSGQPNSTMINDEAALRARLEVARRQIESDFQSMLQFNGSSQPAASQQNNTTSQSRFLEPISRHKRTTLLLDGVPVSLLAPIGTTSRRRLKRTNNSNRHSGALVEQNTDVQNGQLMLATDNMLPKTRPEIGQRVRLSVGDIAQTNLLYKCPKCGKTIQQLSGVFHSPGYHTHNHAQDKRPKEFQQPGPSHFAGAATASVDFCEWRLVVGLGERIMLNITDLDVGFSPAAPFVHSASYGSGRAQSLVGNENDQRADTHERQRTIGATSARSAQDPMIMNNCQSDYLEVRDGYSYRAPLLAKLCGQVSKHRDVLRPIVSVSNRLLVTYRTTAASAGRRGFLVHHETVCGGFIMLGKLLPDPLNMPKVVHTTTTTETQTTATTTGSRVQTSSSGPNLHQPNRSRDSDEPTKILAGQHHLPTPQQTRVLANGSVSVSENEVVLNQSGARPNSSQASTAAAVNNNNGINATSQGNNHIGGRENQRQQPAANSTHAHPVIDAVAHSTGSMRNWSWSAWPMLNSNIIQSPNWPEQYRANRECVWQVKAEENHQISLKFDAFDLEAHDSCAYDYVEVRDGADTNANLIGRFCGKSAPEQVLSSGPNLLVKFVSDSDVNRAGFLSSLQTELDECKLGTHACSYKCSNAAIPYKCECPAGLEIAPDGKNCVPICGGTHNQSAGQITSPAYPDLYPVSTRCTWQIYAPPHHRVTLNFTHFDLEGIKGQECDYDSVEIKSKQSSAGQYVKNGVYCGLNQPFMVTSVGNIVRLEFNSDNSIQKSGFAMNYFIDRDECAINNGGCQHVCTNNIGSYQCSCNNGFILHANKHTCVGSHCLFGISSPEGTFHSPGFPNLYPANKECAWVFSTAPGHRIRLMFDQFDIENHQECAYDYVALFDGESVDDHALGRFCGPKKPLTLVSSFNSMYLVFKSDATNEKRGFNATHSTVCGGRLQANLYHNDSISSHPSFNGSSHYSRNEDCDWLIEANENQRVRIEFTFFALEADPNCNYDQTIVYDGSDDGAPQLARLCGSDLSREQMKITSSGESMLIVFKSDDSINSKGFSLTYSAIESSEDETVAIAYSSELKYVQAPAGKLIDSRTRL